MRVFVCEFVTAGGLRGERLPSSLVREGVMMRDALLADLRDLDGVQVTTAHDDRLTPPTGCESEAVTAAADPFSTWSRLIAGCDLAWPIAPETDRMLERLTALIDASGVTRVGPDPETIRIAGSKIRTARLLQAHGVPTVPTYPPDALPERLSGPLVAKPDDGAGCSQTQLWSGPPLGLEGSRMVVQPFVAGAPASLSVLCAEGRAVLLSANRQHVAIRDGTFRFEGVSVGAVEDDGGLARLAQGVLGALPGLRGIVGIDVILAPEGPVVVDVNPRLTTSYAGLKRWLGINPVTLLPEFAHHPARTPPSRPGGRPIDIRV